MSSRLLIVSAEASSCEYIESLLSYWQKKKISVEAFGVGNKAMEAMGFKIIGSSDEMAFFGSIGIVGKYKKLKEIFDRLLAEVDREQPACALLLDYSGFNLRLAKELKSRNVPVIYYVSPQVWAWDRGRTSRIRAFVDRMLVLFPFEVNYYKEHGIEAEFVGHPALEKIEERYFDPNSTQMYRARFGFAPDDYVIGFMPGSRLGEVERHLPAMMEVARRLNKKFAGVKFAFLTSPNFKKEDLAERLADFRLPYVIIKDEPFAMIHLMDQILVASGTATLMVALLEKPMVVMYRAGWLTGALAKRFIQVPFICIVNLIAGREVVPERVQSAANPDELTKLMLQLIENLEYREKMVGDLHQIRQKLTTQTPATERVAAVVEEYFS